MDAELVTKLGPAAKNLVKEAEQSHRKMTWRKKTEWFPNSINPVHPGMYIVKYGDSALGLVYWRAFDGEHWHCGIPTVAMNCPDYAVFSKHAVVDDDHPFEWCGIVKDEQ